MSLRSLLRLSLGLFVLALFVAVAPGAGASTTATSTVAWTGEYYNNITLSGTPVLRDDPSINFYWPAGTSPIPGYINTSYYSIRWTRSIYFDAGTWTFSTLNDDGMRVWVDDRITMDAWYDQGPTAHAGDIALTAGYHTVRVEYYNKTMGGTAQVTWALKGSYPDWKGEYYNNQTLSGTPAVTRNDPAINFDWGSGSPAANIPVDHFSVRWTRTVYLDAGTYRFTATTDDGMRAWVDGSLIIDAWINQPPTTYTRDVTLGAGNHSLKVEYYENAVTATAKFSYALVTSPPPGTWHGQYYNNMYLSGSPAFVRDDAAVWFDWGTGSPAPGFPSDYFSVKWDGVLYAPTAGNYLLSVTSDDGVRVWADGVLVIDGWWDHPAQTFSVTRYMTAGNHNIHVEYYEKTYLASVKLSITPVSTPGGAWHGQYFSNQYLSGSPAFTRDDQAIDFNWGSGSPAVGFPADHFSVKWDGAVNFPTTGNYVFSATSDDGVRVWVDGVPIIDGWWDHSAQTFSVPRYMGAGTHNVHVEYYENGGDAVVKLTITASAPPPPPSNDVIVDDGGPGWQSGGCSTCWRVAYAGINNHSFWTYNNTSAVANYNWARWYPNLGRAGNFEVYVFIPAGIGNTTNARYWVYHNGTYTLAAKNQGLYANQWVSLGTYYFNGSSSENVSLTDVTYEAYLSHTLVFDAVKFSPR